MQQSLHDSLLGNPNPNGRGSPFRDTKSISLLLGSRRTELGENKIVEKDLIDKYYTHLGSTIPENGDKKINFLKSHAEFGEHFGGFILAVVLALSDTTVSVISRYEFGLEILELIERDSGLLRKYSNPYYIYFLGALMKCAYNAGAKDFIINQSRLTILNSGHKNACLAVLQNSTNDHLSDPNNPTCIFHDNKGIVLRTGITNICVYTSLLYLYYPNQSETLTQCLDYLNQISIEIGLIDPVIILKLIQIVSYLGHPNNIHQVAVRSLCQELTNLLVLYKESIGEQENSFIECSLAECKLYTEYNEVRSELTEGGSPEKIQNFLATLPDIYESLDDDAKSRAYSYYQECSNWLSKLSADFQATATPSYMTSDGSFRVRLALMPHPMIPGILTRLESNIENPHTNPITLWTTISRVVRAFQLFGVQGNALHNTLDFPSIKKAVVLARKLLTLRGGSFDSSNSRIQVLLASLSEDGASGTGSAAINRRIFEELLQFNEQLFTSRISSLSGIKQFRIIYLGLNRIIYRFSQGSNEEGNRKTTNGHLNLPDGGIVRYECEFTPSNQANEEELKHIEGLVGEYWLYWKAQEIERISSSINGETTRKLMASIREKLEQLTHLDQMPQVLAEWGKFETHMMTIQQQLDVLLRLAGSHRR